MPDLQFFQGGQKVLRVPLSGPAFKIGRNPENDLTLPDEEISRFHAAFELREGVFWIVDQSRNGTFVNGRRVRTSQLKDKDEIRMAGWKVLYTEDMELGEKETRIGPNENSSKKGAAFCGMVGKSDGLRQVFSMIEKAAPAMATVLIVGETGTGKELVAHALHDLSPRERRSFVPLNCGAISPQLIESELFGHERGAFTGALVRHEGAFEQAHGGTLFLDEVGELPLELQPKLLRVLEEHRFRRVGGMEEFQSDVRVIAATHRNLEALCHQGRFREDLFFRLFSVPIHLPPLRERSDDIAELAAFFTENLQKGIGETHRKTLSPEAMDLLKDYAWRGNVRELKNVMTRSLLFASGNIIQPPEILFLTGSQAAGKVSLQMTERDAIVSTLKGNDWNKKESAQALGIAKSTLFRKINGYGIKKPMA